MGDGHRVTAMMMKMRMVTGTMTRTTMTTTSGHEFESYMGIEIAINHVKIYMIGSLAGPMSMASRESLR